MKKKSYLVLGIFILMVLSHTLLIAVPVTIDDAEGVADFHLTVKEKSEEYSINDIFVFENTEGDTLSYITNLTPYGFIVLSTDTDITPIIAYSFKGNFPYDEDENNILYHMLKNDMELRLQAIADTTYPKIISNNQLWDVYLNGDLSYLEREFQQWPPEGSTITSGWIETTWTQMNPYNEFCPYDPLPSPSGRSLVGCVATAMAQIINYYKFIGNSCFDDNDDYHSNFNDFDFYIDDNYNDFDFPSFEELNLYLNDLNSHYTNDENLTSNDIAALNFTCGISIQMQYSREMSVVGSCYGVASALSNKFGYTSADYINADDPLFYEILEQNMKDAQPSELVISRQSSGGHAIVCDGYNTDNEYHLNFGHGDNNPVPITLAWYSLPESLPSNYDEVVDGIVEIRDLHGTITGNISLEYQGSGDVTQVEVQAGTIIVNPNENGDYIIHLQPGIYDVTASLYGYEPVTVENIIVNQDDIISDINFLLNIHYPNTITVDINGTGDYTEIQDAIDDPNVIDSDIIMVYPGTYEENINFNGKRIKIVSLYYYTQNYSYIFSTIIDGNNNGSVVAFENGEDGYAQLCGFTINNGYAEKGGGITCSYADPLLKDLIITGNSADYGGGIYSWNAIPKLQDLLITQNIADFCGAGIYIDDYSGIVIYDSKINNNKAWKSGGGIYCDVCSELYLSNVDIVNNNVSNGSGGGIYLGSISAIEFNSEENEKCNIYLNHAPQYGNDLYCCGNDMIQTILDTFTVSVPDNYFAYPVENYNFDILNYKVEQVNVDLYVNPNGSNDNSGIISEEPLKNIYYALAKIIPQQTSNLTIYLSDGVFSPSQSSEVFPINCRGNINIVGESIQNTILDAEVASGVIYCYQDNDFSLENMILENGYSVNGAGIYLMSSSPIINNLHIKNNYATEDGAGIYCYGSNSTISNIFISDNETDAAGASIYCQDSNLNILNLTTYDNIANDYCGGIFIDNECNSSLVNCILWNDTPPEVIYLGSDLGTAIYSDIQDGTGQLWFGRGCIDTDPLFINSSSGDYSLSQASPCIDAGDPYSDLDPDGTQADMGVFSAKTEINTLEDINWISFPILHPDNTNALVVLEPILYPDILEGVYYEDNINPVIWYDFTPPNQHWENGLQDGIFLSEDGYKISMYQNVELEVSGYRKSPSSVINLDAEAENGNWIGYFLLYSLEPSDAFSQVWDNLNCIKSKDWTMFKKHGQWYGVAGSTVDYGKLYIVYCDQDCSFTWGLGLQQDPYEKTETIVFSYEEQLDYMPIFVDSTENLNGIDEIGIFLDDECIGASVVEGYPVFVPAYIEDDSTLTKGGNELTFQVASYGKSGIKSITAFHYNEAQNVFVEKPVILDNKSYTLVRLGTGEGIEFLKEFTLYQNYPNPFSQGLTTISFIPSTEAENSEIKIYNIKGQLVKEFKVQNSKLIVNEVIWDGRDDYGRQVGSGIYFYKIVSGDKTETKKMVLMH